jgi:2-polyprenyl-6-hydroxyphenyl methylase/3-demethylubiquinone-9 3-methyltransferase
MNEDRGLHTLLFYLRPAVRPKTGETLKHLDPSNDWPQSWKDSYFYDLEEIYSEPRNFGYAYAYENRRRRTLGLITEVLPAGGRILDVAAAQGNFTLSLAEMGYDVTWNDLRFELADYVRMKHESGAISFAPGNVFELQFPFLFDAILITEVIEHVAHPDEFLAKISQLVRPGGHVVMTTPNGAYFRNKLPKFSECPDPSAYEAVQFRPNSEGHIFLLYPDEIQQLATRAGLAIERLDLFTNPLTNGHIKLERLLRVLPKSLVFGIEKATQQLPRSLARRCLVQMGVRFRRA